ncbi:MAG: hypothetical protein WDW38_008137 [Sanguina aurantia]
MPPPASKAHRHVLTALQQKPLVALEEDDYQSRMSAIIERDYYPDVPKLQNQLEWLQAVNSGDPLAMRKAQLNIIYRRAGLQTPLAPGIGAPAAATPGTWATPGTNLLRTPAMTPFVAMTPHANAHPGSSHPHTNPSHHHQHQQQQRQQDGGASERQAHPSSTPSVDPHLQPTHPNPDPDPRGRPQQLHGEARAPPLRLDAFLAAYTSEDNASFHALAQLDLARKRAKFAHHLDDKNDAVRQTMALLAAGPHPSDGFGTSGQAPMTLDPVTYDPYNALYYFRDSLPLSAAEIASQAIGGDRSTHPSNTRFNDTPSAEAAAAAAAAAEEHRRDVAAAALRHGPTQHTNDNSHLPAAPSQHGDLPPPPYLATPSMTPGRDAGGVALDASGVIGGPAFKVTQASKREQLGRELAAKSASYPSAARQALARPSGLLDSLRRGSTPLGAAGGAQELSAAARRLAASVLQRGGTGARSSGGGGGGGSGRGGRGGGAGNVVGLADSQLRATYSAGGGGTGGRSSTPSGGAGQLRAGGRSERGRGVRTGGGSGAAGGGSWVTPLIGASGEAKGSGGGSARHGAKASAAVAAAAGLSAQNLTDGLLDL